MRRLSNQEDASAARTPELHALRPDLLVLDLKFLTAFRTTNKHVETLLKTEITGWTPELTQTPTIYYRSTATGLKAPDSSFGLFDKTRPTAEEFPMAAQNSPESLASPPGRESLDTGSFRFSCRPENPCFNRCCHNPDLELYPYDIVRLCSNLGMTSDVFLKTYTHNLKRSNPCFPSVMLTMSRNSGHPCPFLSESGCRVYADRPDACRMFPLERGVSVTPFSDEEPREEYWLQRVPYCLGHGIREESTVAQWVREQGLQPYNRMGELWAEMSLLFRRNPWGPEGSEGRIFRMAFMVCYNADQFRNFVTGTSFLQRYRLHDAWEERITTSNEHLLEFGFDWLKHFMFNVKPRLFTPA